MGYNNKMVHTELVGRHIARNEIITNHKDYIVELTDNNIIPNAWELDMDGDKAKPTMIISLANILSKK